MIGPESQSEIGRQKRLWRAALVAALLGLIAVGWVGLRTAPLTHPIHSFRVGSNTMLPTFNSGDVVLTNRAAYVTHPPERGDIVVFRLPAEIMKVKAPFVKRVAGIPGDRIAVRGGKLWRNGEVVPEPYIKEPMTYTWPDHDELTVPEGCVIVLGDNRNNSNDSHYWEQERPGGGRAPAPFLPADRIIGNVLHRR